MTGPLSKAVPPAGGTAKAPGESAAAAAIAAEIGVTEADLGDEGVEYAPPSALLERIVAVVVLLLSVCLLIGARSIDVRTETGGVDPRWWPTLLGGLAVAFSLVLSAIAFTRAPMERDDLEMITRPGWVRLLATLGSAVVFIVLWDLEVNFLIIVTVLMVGLLLIFGARNWKQLVLFPAAMTATIWALFVLLLRVPL